ncbi:MAG: alpha/beta hydrolase [Anaerolineales bacterium]|nr:alpha/beta hydrolase [Anaerolineales bacterium]
MAGINPKQDRRPAGCLGWGLHILAGLVILTLVLLGAGFGAQLKTTADDFRQYPAPGQLVDIGGTRLHIHCTGEGSPTVVIDAGNGDFSLSWTVIQAELSATTRICTYDRAGYGWSDPSRLPRTAGNIAQELHALLVNANIPGPYVLVGHSLGGYGVRLFASLYPDEMAGMVLADAGHEEQFERLPAAYQQVNRQQVGVLSTMSFLARFGLLRLMGNSSGGHDLAPSFIWQLPEDVQPVYLALMSHPGYFDATLAELNALEESSRQVQAAGDLDGLPLVVLTAGSTLTPDALQSIGLPPDFPVREIQQVWLELQAELAALSTDSTHTIIDCGHAIHLERPEAVVAAILQVVAAAR